MSDPYIGEIRLFAGNYAPEGWSFCDGSLLSIAGNDALFSLVGITYGGDGQTTFALPDLRGRLPVNQGQGSGLTPRTIGQTFGVESVGLTVQQIPSHSHSFSATTAAADNTSPAGTLFADTGDNPIYSPSTETPTLQTMDARAVANTGASQPHDNIMPSLAINYIISLVGLYPIRD